MKMVDGRVVELELELEILNLEDGAGGQLHVAGEKGRQSADAGGDRAAHVAEGAIS